ncbi:DNA mismatch repair protein MutL, partial [Pediococcus acidilactici]|nr:DNA mismatch repair protein MutL [Pediococcus acidilactici]
KKKVINIQTDPLLVDVNVHTSKLEVRISEENTLTELISKTIFDRLADQNLIPDAVDNLKKKRISKPAGEQLDLTETVLSGSFGKPTPTESAAVEEDDSAAALHPSVAATKPIIISTRQDLQSDRISEFREKYADSTTFVTKNENTEGEEKTSSTSRFPALTYIGQMHGTYLFAGADDGFFIIV